MLILTFKGQIVLFFLSVREGSGELCPNCSIFRQYYLHGCHFDLLWGHSKPFLFPFLLTALGSSLNCHNLLFCFSVLCLSCWDVLWHAHWFTHTLHTIHLMFYQLLLFFYHSLHNSFISTFLLLCLCEHVRWSWPKVKAASSEFKHMFDHCHTNTSWSCPSTEPHYMI